MTRPLTSRPVAVAGGLLADRIVGEPPTAFHPVVAFGRVMQAAERARWRDDRGAGVTHLATGVALGAVTGAVVRSPMLATTVAVAGRSLTREAASIAAALDAGDLETARRRLPALVGRDVDELDTKGVARAVVESVAENTVDAVVAPVWWALVAGAPGAFAYRAVNTLDAMVGHHDERYERFGWAAARLDDAAAWGPARATALLVAAVRPQAAAAIFDAVRHDAPAHPSPNAGVAEAAFAAALGVRLGGPLSYRGRIEVRPSLGTGSPPDITDIGAAIRLTRDATVALASVLLVSGLVAPALARVVRQHAGQNRRTQ